MVTAPVHKAVINDADIAFSGHTEYLAATTGADKVVMMLTAGDLQSLWPPHTCPCEQCLMPLTGRASRRLCVS